MSFEQDQRRKYDEWAVAFGLRTLAEIHALDPRTAAKHGGWPAYLWRAYWLVAEARANVTFGPDSDIREDRVLIFALDTAIESLKTVALVSGVDLDQPSPFAERD